MQAALADLVHPVLRRVLAVRDRLDAGETLPWDHERSGLKEMLAALEPVGASLGFDLSDQGSPAEQSRLTRGTIRYALVSWIDEFLGQHSVWGPRWREKPLETELYGSTQGSRKFWEEARYAETRGDRDALEVILWCVALGFSGAWRGKPETLRTWQARITGLLDRTAPTWTMPGCLLPSPHEQAMPTDLPTRRLTFSLLLGISLLLPLLALLLWRNY